ncbi:hypothetical protein CISG_00970 [Coccidioides immitis RMSCC 3703]|uniref:Uncharacterized protein n=1 Tax=Coccidioides immitis RMSCC 3703 TaxID=454286 RepID=A0A0J8QW01_COCIT|nr:hypothetical protein CISG_00970 [Coccidioides immitis RMSCC 3703]
MEHPVPTNFGEDGYSIPSSRSNAKRYIHIQYRTQRKGAGSWRAEGKKKISVGFSVPPKSTPTFNPCTVLRAIIAVPPITAPQRAVIVHPSKLTPIRCSLALNWKSSRPRVTLDAALGQEPTSP